MAIDVDSTELDTVTDVAPEPTVDAAPQDSPVGDRDGSADDTNHRSSSARNARTALAVAAAAVMVLAALTAWLGWQAHHALQLQTQRSQFIAAARQGALNLTTISYTEADTDVQRILDNATGAFYDDFKNRSGPFVEVVKQAKAQTVGTITEAALQSVDGDTAHVLVAVAVSTTNAGTSEPQPRAWRMKVTVQAVGDTAKVSNVEFVA